MTLTSQFLVAKWYISLRNRSYREACPKIIEAILNLSSVLDPPPFVPFGHTCVSYVQVGSKELDGREIFQGTVPVKPINDNDEFEK